MPFPYKNPLTSAQLAGAQSVVRTSTFGTNFSVLNTGGFMEVYCLNDLKLVLTASTYPSNIQLSANTIPINFTKGLNPLFTPDFITLNSDNISSGRRRLGMLVFVQETDTVYQFSIPNYEILWGNVSGQTPVTITESVYSTIVRTTTPEGTAFVNAWTASTIENVDGVSRNDARWKIFYAGGAQVTGATYFSATSTLELYNVTGGTVPVTGFTSGSGLISVSANTGLGIVSGNTLFTTYNTLLDSSLSMPSTVGGIPAGTTVTDLSGDTFVSLFNDLLFPTVQPTYTIPTISIGGVSNTTAEVGSTISLSLTATGVKNDAGQYTQLRLLRDTSTVLFTDTTLTSGSTTDIPAQFGYTDPNNPNASYTLSPTPYSEIYTLPAPTGLNTSTSTTYKSDGDYDSGLAKLNNKGGTDVRTPQVRSSNAPQLSATSFNSTTFTYTNIYPYFYGTSSSQPTASGIASLIAGGTTTKVLSSASGDIQMNFNTTTQYLWVAVFSNYTNKTLWYVNELNKGAIGGLTNLFGTPIIQSVNSPNGYWSGINFDVYISNYQTTNDTMYLKNS